MSLIPIYLRTISCCRKILVGRGDRIGPFLRRLMSLLSFWLLAEYWVGR
jgi:hypothetical protein